MHAKLSIYRVFVYLQTCNAQLAQKDRSLFMDGVSLSLPARVPIEADLLLYHSEVSGYKQIIMIIVAYHICKK